MEPESIVEPGGIKKQGVFVVNRIALITESSTRQDSPMPAYRFYQGSRSRWVNNIIRYMEVRNFSEDNIFFLSVFGQRIIGYQEIIDPYPVRKWHPRKDECTAFAEKVLAFIQQIHPLPFVEIHTGKTISDPLKRLFDEKGIEYRVYGDGVPLGAKPTWYAELIENELTQIRLKEIEREKMVVSSLIQFQSPQEASHLIDQFENKAHLYGIEANIEELKKLLGSYRQKKKDAKKAYEAFNNVMEKEDIAGEFNKFLLNVQSLAELHGHAHFEEIKSRFGQSVAKLRLYLIKHNYALMAEYSIFAALQRMQIALLK